MEKSEAVAAATQAYIYGYPLVYNLEEIAKLPAGESTIFGTPVPWNHFGPVRHCSTRRRSSSRRTTTPCT